MISYVRLQIVTLWLYISRSLCTLLPLTLPRLAIIIIIIVIIIEQHVKFRRWNRLAIITISITYLDNFARGEKLNILSAWLFFSFLDDVCLDDVYQHEEYANPKDLGWSHLLSRAFQSRENSSGTFTIKIDAYPLHQHRTLNNIALYIT